MNAYINSSELLGLNQSLILQQGTTLYLEHENAKEHGLAEDKNITYRIILSDQYFFNPFSNDDLSKIYFSYPETVSFGGKSYERKYFIKNILSDKDTNKAAICMKHTREALKIEGFQAAYYLDGAMMCLYLLDTTKGFVADKVSHHARVNFRNGKGYDPITGNLIIRANRKEE